MEDVKERMKGLMKKVNNPFSSSSSSKFKGQGHVLGSGPPPSSSSLPHRSPSGPPPSSSSSSSSSSLPHRSPSGPPPSSSSSSLPHRSPSGPPPSSSSSSLPHRSPSDPRPRSTPTPTRPASDTATSFSSSDFNPFDPLVSSARLINNPTSPVSFSCPVCSRPFSSEADVSTHLEGCLSPDSSGGDVGVGVAARVEEFLSAGPPDGAVDVVLKLLGNVARDPANVKFRRIRMANPKIKEAAGDAKGGKELLEYVGFRLGEEAGEVWATMEVPSSQQVSVIKEAVLLLESWKLERLVPAAVSDVELHRMVKPKQVDRQVRVFFSVPESEASKIDLPDSFYSLSTSELKREADLRKKRLADSQLLVPKSYREKQAMARRKYKRAVVRIQFPDGVLLQGVFLPWEPTTVLYEFVSSALKEPTLEFELLRPAVPKLRVIPHFPKPGDKSRTLEEEELVPSALLKFKPAETEDSVFTGLTNELLEASEPPN